MKHTDVLAEQVRLLRNQTAVGINASLINSLIMAVVLWEAIEPSTIIAWVATLWSISLFRLWRARVYTVSDDKSKNIRRWAREFTLHHFATGCIWGSSGVFLFSYESLLHQAFIYMMIGGMTAGGVGVQSVLLSAAFAFCLPTALPLLINSFYIGDTIHNFIAISMILFLAIMYRIAIQINQHILSSITLNHELKTEIAIRKQTEAALFEAKEAAEEANKLKDKFVTLVSHDLRSPMSSTLGHLEIIEKKAKNSLEPTIQGYLDRSIKNCLHLLGMVDQLLEINRLNTGKITIRKKYLEARAFFEHALGWLFNDAKEKGVTITMVAPDGATLFADEALFGELIQNLVGNAVKFCDAGDVITVAIDQKTPFTVEVRDTGPGIDPAFLPELFTLSVRTTMQGTKGEKGTGLGLPLCHDIMAAHGGKLEVASTPGEGTVFFCHLPESKPLILLVDDQARVRDTVIDCLKSVDAEIVEASNGQEAMDRLADIKPHLVITDIVMPVVDGLELLGHMRKSPRTAAIPVIVMTSREGDDIREKAKAAGANGFYIKPVDRSDFLAGVKKYF